MEEKKGYNVLKLVMQGNRCYVSTDYIRGKPLIYWLKYHPGIPKEQFYRWISEILRSLEYFHQTQGAPSYQYVNPYSIIVSEEQKLFLLDAGNKKHEDMLHLMQRRMVREHFLSTANQYYQKASVREDIYGLGKTLQYLIASAEITPSLSKREEKKLQKIISKCLNQKSKKSYQNIREISEHFPKRIEKKYFENNKKKWKAALYGTSLSVMIVLNLGLVVKLNEKPVYAAKIQSTPKIIETKVEVKEEQLSFTDRQTLFELLEILEEKIKEQADISAYASLLKGYDIISGKDHLSTEVIQAMLDKKPEMKDTEEFKQFQRNYEITINEEGKVCVKE